MICSEIVQKMFCPFCGLLTLLHNKIFFVLYTFDSTNKRYKFFSLQLHYLLALSATFDWMVFLYLIYKNFQLIKIKPFAYRQGYPIVIEGYTLTLIFLLVFIFIFLSTLELIFIFAFLEHSCM